MNWGVFWFTTLVTLYIMIAVAFEKNVGRIVFDRGIPEGMSPWGVKVLAFILSIFWPLFFVAVLVIALYRNRAKQSKDGTEVTDFESVEEPDTMEGLIDELLEKKNED